MKNEIPTSFRINPELRTALGIICSMERKKLKEKLTELVKHEIIKKKAIFSDEYYNKLFEEEIK